MQKVVVLRHIWLYEIIGGTLPMCQNATMRVNGAWTKRYCVLCSKTFNTLHSCQNFPAGSRQAARGARICETSLFVAGWVVTFLFQNILTFKCSRHVRHTTWWRHQMETFVRGIHRWQVNSPLKGQWRGALMFSLICARINGWVNNGEAGD